MECHCLPAHELPHTSRLYSAFLTDFSKVSRFYAHRPDGKGIRAAAKGIALDAAVRQEVTEILRGQNAGFGCDAATSRNLDRLTAGAVAVVTGQQVGLFSGPAFSFYKALTAVHLARQLSEEGLDAVPIFWLAGEDHDLAEVNHCYWAAGQGLERLEVHATREADGRSVGSVRLESEILPVAERAAQLLQGEASEWVEQALRASYRPEETFSSALGKLMARLLAGRGLILLDPVDTRLHRFAALVYRRALEESETLAADLLARGKELDRAGYHAQVKVTDRSTLLFLEVDGKRTPLSAAGGRNAGYVAGRASFSRDELRDLLESAPERFSANVLLRPVVQDALLPTAAYVGGPAEVAYFAQAEVVYRRLLGRMPAVLPRAAFTLVDAGVAKLLRRYQLTPAEVLRGRQAVRRKMELVALAPALMRQFDSGEKTLRSLLRKLRAPLRKLDHTLEGALETGERKMLHQFLKLRAKAGRSQNFRTGVLDRHERALLETLHPHRALQERVLCLLPMLARHGPSLLDELERRATGGAQHQFLFL